MAPHSSTRSWKIPWTEDPGRLQSMGSLRVGHDWATSLSLFTFLHWRRQWQPTPVFLPGESQGRGSLVGCRLWGRTESDTTEVTQQQQQQQCTYQSQSSNLFLCPLSSLVTVSLFSTSVTLCFIFFYFIFKLYIIVLVLPNIKMNPPQVYMCSPPWTLLPPPSPYHPSGSSQCTSPKHPVSCIEPGLATRFIHDILHVSMPFSQMFPPSSSPTESIRLFYINKLICTIFLIFLI